MDYTTHLFQSSLNVLLTQLSSYAVTPGAEPENSLGIPVAGISQMAKEKVYRVTVSVEEVVP
jgi:hypothetical protein